MNLQLKSRRALVTGSTAGIGLAIAQALAAEGANVIVNGRTQKRVDEAIATVRKSNPGASAAGEISGIAADLSTTAGIETLTGQINDLDILINNLGIFEIQAFEKITDSEWMKMFETNVMSGVRLSRRYLPAMLKRNSGRIVFISSESAVQIPTEMIHYGMTKTAQLAVARGLAQLTTGSNVTVNSVLAGPTMSEGVGKFVSDLAKSKNTSPADVERDFFKTMRPTSLLQRFTSTAEVANMVAYLCSPLASATNGAAIRADGGVLQGIL